MLPNFLIIGAPRSGTTWIDENLRRHPDIFMPAKKEIHFFDRHYQRGIGFYESFFTEHCGQRAVGEATPDYLHGEYTTNDIPALIHTHVPDARLIVCLRNPIDRLYSRFWNSKARFKKNREMTFEQKLLGKPEFIREGFYFDQLQKYLAYFPREQLLILLHEQIKADPVAFLQEIYRFIGVDEHFTSGLEKTRINAAAGRGHLAKSKALFYLSGVLSRMNLIVLSERVRQLNSDSIPPMMSKTRRELGNIYRDKNLQLQGLLKQDISHWNPSLDIL